MTDKRFTLSYINEEYISANLYDNGTYIGSIDYYGDEHILKLLNDLSEENEQLKEEKEKWKSNCSLAISENSILWNEISILREQGAEPSDAFNDYLNKKRGD